MTHFCPIRCEGKSYWEVSGNSVFSLEIALGRNALLLLRALLWLDVCPGNASASGRSQRVDQRKEAGEGETANATASFHWHQRRVKQGHIVSRVLLLRWDRSHTRRDAQLCTLVRKVGCPRACGWLSQAGFSCLLRGTVTPANDKTFITAPFVRSSQDFLLTFRGIPFQIILEL